MAWREMICGVGAMGTFSLAGLHPAAAQSASAMAEWQYSSGVQLQRLFEPKIPTWEVEVGAGAQFGPAADGLRRYTVQGGPAIDIRYKDIAFLSTGEGLGVNLFSFRHISVGAALTYDLGRSPHVDGRDLNGLGTIHMAPEVKLFATTVLSKSFPLTLRVDVRKQLGASFGYVGDIGAYMPMPGSSRKFAWFMGPSVTLADTRYMTTYFGVSHTQAASTRYHFFKAHGGVEQAGIGISATYFVTPHVLVDLSGGYQRLMGDAADSPITQTPNDESVSLAVMYKF
ncbi:MipA/OmpV family protein [Acidocella facilis]|uniref:MipA/OmpV family protein n=1 Tax=Acidocella facilis TaxID=525 RepID=UPI001F431C9B|nr:MipA/OmpV family protein [Acidocella facilis]